MTSLLFTGKNKMDVNQDTTKLHPLICTTFFFAYIWAIGGNLITKSIEAFDSFARELFSDTNDVKVSGSFIILCVLLCTTAKIPGSGEVFDYFVDFDTGRLESWEKIIPAFTYDKEVLHMRCVTV